MDGSALRPPLHTHTAQKVGYPRALGAARALQALLIFFPLFFTVPTMLLPTDCATVPAAGSKGVTELSYFLFGAEAQDIFSIGSTLTNNLHKDWSVEASVQV